jgi:hypothetical protein
MDPRGDTAKSFSTVSKELPVERVPALAVILEAHRGAMRALAASSRTGVSRDASPPGPTVARKDGFELTSPTWARLLLQGPRLDPVLRSLRPCRQCSVLGSAAGESCKRVLSAEDMTRMTAADIEEVTRERVLTGSGV